MDGDPGDSAVDVNWSEIAFHHGDQVVYYLRLPRRRYTRP